MVNINTSQTQPIFNTDIPNNKGTTVSDPKDLKAKAYNDDVLFIGFNRGAKDELAVLKKGAINFNFKIENISDTENWKIDNFNLKTEKGVSDFIDSLSLSDEKQKKELESIILDIDSGITDQKTSGRDEVAAIIKVWSRAEKEEEIPSRLAISGHGNSISVWGDDKGHLDLVSINKIVKAMPKAASKIEDVLITACRFGYQDNIENLQKSFPNLKTVWGYAGTAPLGQNGGTEHIKEWELKTRGENSNIDRNQELKTLKGVPQYKNIAVWSKDNGYQRSEIDPNTLNAEEINSKIERYRNGIFETDNVKNELDTLYNTIQDLKSTCPPEFKEQYNIDIERVNILRHFPEVLAKFDETLGNEIKEGFKLVGIEPPELKPTDKNKFITQFMKKTETLIASMGSDKFDKLAKDQKNLVQKTLGVVIHPWILNADFISQDWLTSDLTPDIKKKIMELYKSIDY